MVAEECLQEGRLDDAVRALSLELRDRPADAKRRTFLFELLCFSGEWDRGEKQLSILEADGNLTPNAAEHWRAVLGSERTRQSSSPSEFRNPSEQGFWNGSPFEQLRDADYNLGSQFEFFGSTGYHRVPISEISSVRMQPPARLRDLIWSRANLCFRGKDGEFDVLLPVLTVGAVNHPDPLVRLGRVTVWEEQGGQILPKGQRMFSTGSEMLPLLKLRSLKMEIPT